MRIPEDAIPAAAFRFESHRGLPLGPMETVALQKHGFQDLDPELLARELKHLITAEHKGDSRDRQQAYWALGKKRDPALVSFSREELCLELQRDRVAVYQLTIALEDLRPEIVDLPTAFACGRPPPVVLPIAHGLSASLRRPTLAAHVSAAQLSPVAGLRRPVCARRSRPATCHHVHKPGFRRPGNSRDADR